MLLSIYFGICVFIGVKWALIVFSLFMLVLAAVFSIKKDSYAKYIAFVNPKYSLLYSSKDADFRRSHRRSDIVVFCIISLLMLLISLGMPNITLAIEGSSLMYLIAGTVILSIILWGISLFILKNSKKNSSFWFYFTALLSAVLLVIAII